jgi:deoxycytidylate deaminase
MMVSNAKKVEGASSQKPPGLFDVVSTKEVLFKTHTNELVIALCGSIGSPLHQVSEKLRDMLVDKFGYEECKIIRLSTFIKEQAMKAGQIIPDKPGFAKINALIDFGGLLRSTHGSGVLAELAIHEIRLERENFKEANNGQRHEPRKICHIIDSIKNQEELDLLRTVYREMLYVVGVFAPMTIREQNLKNMQMDAAEIYKLIDRDSGEEAKTGQTVRDTFPQSDFFLRMDSATDTQLEMRVERFLHLILGTKIITPTLNETAMYAATSAAGHSACLSRQVGAAVTDETGEVISTGWNDVPKFGGGLYMTQSSRDPGAEQDKRCWNIDNGKCANDEEKSLLAENLIAVLQDVIVPGKTELALKLLMGNSKLRGLIEFSRSIHAEMHALLNAGKIAGSKIKNGKLFVTTYPCHSCARHIIAAGISEVYYIEPYRKSLAIKLHGDAISENETEINKVRVLPYDGVAPTKYLSLFRMTPDSRKRDGKMIKINPRDATLRLEKSLEALPALEALVVQSLQS